MRLSAKTFLVFALVFSLTTRSENIEKPVAETAVFAGGCFWCMEPPFDDLKSKGVISTEVGYAGGETKNPTYKDVSAGGTGHLEVIRVKYNPEQIKFSELLKVFWRNIDPYDSEGQFCDKGSSYLSAVFYSNEEQKKDYERSLQKSPLKENKDKIATKLLPLEQFYSAEDYHQDYYIKNPIRYKFYRARCGRDQRLKEIWGAK